MNPIDINIIKTEKFPIIVFKGNSTISETDFNVFLSILSRYLESKTKFALLVDASLCTNVPIRASFMLSSWMKKHKEQIKEYLVGSAVVFNSSLIIKLVNLAFQIQKPVKPNKITRNYDEAELFLKSII